MISYLAGALRRKLVGAAVAVFAAVNRRAVEVSESYTEQKVGSG